MRRLVVAFLLLGGLAGLGGRLVAAREPARVASPAHVVREGDTLWGIARRLAPEGDPRPIVERLMEANGLAGPGVRPGQFLRLPRR